MTLLESRLRAAFPALRLSMESPPFRTLSSDEDAAAVGRINASGAGFVFVGLGYFADESGCALAIERLLIGGDDLVALQNAARARHSAAFTWDKVLGEYEVLLAGWV